METIDTVLMPRHIAIIMDGNGRWAKKRLLERVKGHEKGAEAVRETITTCRKLGLNALSLYAFSEENWERPRREVEALMHLLRSYLIKERSEILDNNIRLVVSGHIQKLPPFVLEKLTPLMEDSSRNDGMFLNLCLAYGGRDEIVDTCRKIAERVKTGDLQPKDVTEQLFERHLYVPELPPVDLMIRTSGELRTSGFMPWQTTYAEFVFLDVLWPDFSKQHLFEAIREFQRRERRFGNTAQKID